MSVQTKLEQMFLEWLEKEWKATRGDLTCGIARNEFKRLFGVEPSEVKIDGNRCIAKGEVVARLGEAQRKMLRELIESKLGVKLEPPEELVFSVQVVVGYVGDEEACEYEDDYALDEFSVRREERNQAVVILFARNYGVVPNELPRCFTVDVRAEARLGT